jgi:hypothetical protein
MMQNEKVKVHFLGNKYFKWPLWRRLTVYNSITETVHWNSVVTFNILILNNYLYRVVAVSNNKTVANF